MTAASCKPSRYRSSFSVANASISGNSVVPGFPNMISTPSCLSRSRKARFPDMTGKTFSQGWGVSGGAPRRRGWGNFSGGTDGRGFDSTSYIADARRAKVRPSRKDADFAAAVKASKREPDDAEHLAARSEKLRDAQADRG